MNAFEKSKWIWPTATHRADEYAEFLCECDFFGKGAELYISSDSNYTVYVNGSLAAFGQYADFPYMKVYDKIDLSAYMRHPPRSHQPGAFRASQTAFFRFKLPLGGTVCRCVG